MKPIPHAIVAVCLFTAGLLGARAFCSGAAPSSTMNPVAADSSRSARSSPTREDGKSKRRSLASIIALREADARKPGDLQAALERVDIATLRTVVLDQYRLLAAMTDGGKKRKPHQDLYTAAMNELWKRQKMAAFEWAGGLEVTKERAMMTKSLLRCALKEDPAAALPWMQKYHAEFGRTGTIDEFTTIAIRGAVARGVEDVIRAHAMFAGENFHSALHGMSYPEDFDFARLYQELGGKVNLNSAISEWTLRDRNAAWEAIKTQLTPDSRATYEQLEALRSLVRAVVAKDGEADGMQWALTQLSALDPARRLEYLQGISTRNEFSPEGIAAIANSLPPDDRADYAGRLAGASDIGPRAYAALDTLPRENLLYVIHRDIYQPRLGPDASIIGNDQASQRIWEEVRTRYQLTPEEISRITRPSREW